MGFVRNKLFQILFDIDFFQTKWFIKNRGYQVLREASKERVSDSSQNGEQVEQWINNLLIHHIFLTFRAFIGPSAASEPETSSVVNFAKSQSYETLILLCSDKLECLLLKILLG